MPSSKPFTVFNMAQGSPEWLAARSGVFTASRADDAFAKTQKGAWTAKRKDYRSELAVARLTGKPKEAKPASFVMKDGLRREAGALRDYENIHGVVVRSCGFVLDNDAPIGCSPDGVIGDFEGLVQVKCPMQATHLATLLAVREAHKAASNPEILTSLETLLVRCIPSEYRHQIAHELFVTGADWCDYFSHHDDFPDKLRAVTIRVSRSDIAPEHHATQVMEFLAEVDAECEQIAELLR